MEDTLLHEIFGVSKSYRSTKTEIKQGGVFVTVVPLDKRFTCPGWDVHRAKVFGRCEAQSGIAPFDRLVDQGMQQSPYREARRVFLIVDNGSSHRGQRSVLRLQNRYPNLTVVHGPVHASWLNQIEIYFSILQQKVLTPNDFPSLAAVAERLAQIERHYEEIARPFEWRFTRRDLNQWLEILAVQAPLHSALAA